MMIFSPGPVRAGDGWDYAGNSANAATHFKLKTLSGSEANLACTSEFNLGPEELKTVRQALQLGEVTGLELKQSRMLVAGAVEFLLPAARPAKGEMSFDKFYEMSLPGEAWQLQETERFKLSLEVSP